MTEAESLILPDQGRASPCDSNAIAQAHFRRVPD